MKLHSFLLQCSLLLGLVSWTRAQAETFNLTINDLPACGLECLVYTVPAAGCDLTDTDCQCQSQDLTEMTVACMLANCTMADTLQTAKVQASLCQLPNPSYSRNLIILVSVLISVVAALIFVRVASKAQIGWSVGSDDVCLVVAFLIAIVAVGCIIEMSKLGFGKHIWGLQPGHLLRILRLFYVAENAYVIVLALVKISLVLFYLRIFPTGRFRIAAWITFGFIVTSSTILFFLTVFSCKPVAFFWNLDIHGTCIDRNAVAYANSGLAVVQDIIIITLPIAMLPRLNMRRKQKIAVGFMFAVGSFGCITSIVRLRALLVFGNSLDPSWDYVPVVQWTSAELGAGFICACLPSIRILLKRVCPRVFAHWTQDTSSTASPYYNLTIPSANRDSVSGHWMSVSSGKPNSPPPSDRIEGLNPQEMYLTALPATQSSPGLFSAQRWMSTPPAAAVEQMRRWRDRDVREIEVRTPMPPPKDFPPRSAKKTPTRGVYPWEVDSMPRSPLRAALGPESRRGGAVSPPPARGGLPLGHF